MVAGAAEHAAPSGDTPLPASGIVANRVRSTEGAGRVPEPPAPLITAAVSLVGVILLCSRSGRLWPGLFVAALALASLSVPMFLPPCNPFGLGRGSAALLLLSAALGIGAGMARLWPLLPFALPGRDPVSAETARGFPRPGLLHSGLPLAQVRRFEAVLVRDSSGAPAQATRYDLRLRRVMTLEAERSAGAAGSVVLWVDGGPRLAAGRLVEATGRLQPASSGAPHGLTARIGASALTVKGYRTPLAAWRAGLLEGLRRRLARLDPAAAATLEALVLGSREELSSDLYEDFRASGSLHLLALSGLHVGILYLLVRLLLAFAPRKNLRSLAACAVLLGYLFLVGFRPSLFRAVAMIVTGVMAAVFDRDLQPGNLLALSVVALLMIDPVSANSLSFQLSFLAVAGILLFAPGFQRWLGRVLPPVASAPLAYSLAAQAATAPLLLARFGAIHPVGVLAALPLVPLAAAIIWAGLGYLALAGTMAAGPLAAVVGGLQRALEACVELFAGVPPLFGLAALPMIALLLAAALLGRLPRAPRLLHP